MIKLRYLFLSILLLLGKTLFAQEEIVKAWGGGADYKDLSFGFTFQYVSTDYKIVKDPDWRNPSFYQDENGNPVTDVPNSISSKASQGFGIGFITRYSLTDHLEARVTPTLVFADRLLTYNYDNSDPIEKQLQTTVAEFPLLLKLKSDRLGNFRGYLIGGVKYSHLIAAKKNAVSTDPLDKLVTNVGGYGSYEAGIGCDFYFEYFKFSPELKISNSFGNVLTPDNNNPFARPIDKLFLHTLTFNLYFE
jgi:hypothetical protein